MFEGFNWSLLDDPLFKEDSVREELIVPILERLGYTAAGPHQIQRGRPLIHPFVMIGAKRHKVNIVPDYLLLVNGVVSIVLEAKAPNEAVVKSEHVEQAFSYAIHPEVRAPFYALCNGREFAVYSTFELAPLWAVPLSALDDVAWGQLEKLLAPSFVKEPWRKDFLPDYGVLLTNLSFPRTVDIILPFNTVGSICKVANDFYTIDSGIEENEINYAISLDCNERQFRQLLALAPARARAELEAIVSSQPFRGALSSPFDVVVSAKLGEPTVGAFETFVPLVVNEFSAIP